MSAGWPAGPEVPVDTRPRALLLGGLRRGALLVFLPIFVGAQAIAWVSYLVTGWYRATAWLKIGIAGSLLSVRVPFDASLPEGATSTLVVALGALTVAVLVLGFRAGREQAAGFEDRPGGAALAGAAVGLGSAIPAFLLSLPVTLSLPRFGIDRLAPVTWLAFALPLAVAGAAGATGGLDRARDGREDGLGSDLVAAARGGAIAVWWAVVGAFLAVLVAAALSPRQVGSYARFVDHEGGAGAAIIVQHALLLPNQSVLVVATSMGATTTLAVNGADAVDVTRTGAHGVGAVGRFLAGLVGSQNDELAAFPWWFGAFILVPAGATVWGGRAAAAGATTNARRLARGAGAGIVYAALIAIAVWAASVQLPFGRAGVAGTVSLGASPVVAGAWGVAWGVLGCGVGALVPWPGRLSAGSATPR